MVKMHLFGRSCSNTVPGTSPVTGLLPRVLGVVLQMKTLSEHFLQTTETQLSVLVSPNVYRRPTTNSQATIRPPPTSFSSWERAPTAYIIWLSCEFGTAKICSTPLKMIMEEHLARTFMVLCINRKYSNKSILVMMQKSNLRLLTIHR